MITYNHEDYIAQAIEGVLMQKTDFNFNLVIGEDCGSDGTRKICEQYQQKYPDVIELLPSNQNLGIVPNFLRTIEACQSKYIAFCEGDDYWIDDMKLQKQFDFLEEHSDHVICATNFNIVQDEAVSKENAYSLKVGEKTLEDLLISNQFCTPTVCIRADILNKFNLHNLMDYKIGDWPLWLSIMKYGKGIVLDDCTTVYREHRQGAFSLIPYHSKLKLAVLTVSKFLNENNVETSHSFHQQFQKNVWSVLFQTKNPKERISIIKLVLPILDLNVVRKRLLMFAVKLPNYIFKRFGWRLLKMNHS